MTTASETATNVAHRMGEAASAWLDALGPEQRAKASLDFNDTEERTSWAYFPRPSKGLPLLEWWDQQARIG